MTPKTSNAPRIEIAVVGAHLTGMPLNADLLELGAQLERATVTASCYRLYALSGTVPAKPGLLRVSGDGASIAVEVWSLTAENFGLFVASIPAPLGIGTLTLEDGAMVKGFIAEPIALEQARDITQFGGWRAYMSAGATSPTEVRTTCK